MCGICGVVGEHRSDDIERMIRSLGHRGPDGRGVRHEPPTGSAHLSLGHTRLSIVDLTDAANEPMPNEDGSVWLVFNGEIYNFNELREDLQRRGHSFRSRCDAEVVLHLYEEKGEACVDDLNGMFAFAIWDSGNRKMFLARDPLGIKPLYYSMAGDTFWFASEPRAIAQATGSDESMDPDALLAYLTFLYIPCPHTPYRGIRKLSPGTWMKLQNGSLSLHRYWRPSTTDIDLGERDLLVEVRRRIFEAVSRELVSDVPLGAFLSGGIDSSAIVAAMTEQTGAPVRTFCIGFPDSHPSYDEREKAQRVATAFGTDHRELLVEPRILETLAEVVWHMGEPCADSSSLLTYLISREARHEVTVALTGIGGDELFAGYPRYLGLQLHSHYQLMPRFLRRWAATAASRWLPDQAAGVNVAGRSRRFLEAGVLEADAAYLDWISFLPPGGPAAVFQPGFLSTVREQDPYRLHTEILAESGARGVAERALLLDLQTYLTDDLLFLADRMSMAHGLELRVPFCDPDLVKLAMSLSVKQKAPRGQLKGLQKQAMRGILPDEILQQKKQGFMAPMPAWLRGELRPVCEELLSTERVERRGIFNPSYVTDLLGTHFAGRRDFSDQIYALLVLEVWHHVHMSESQPPSLGELL